MRGEVLQIECGLGVVRFRENNNNQNGCLVGFYVKFVDNLYFRQDLEWQAKKTKVVATYENIIGT